MGMQMRERNETDEENRVPLDSPKRRRAMLLGIVAVTVAIWLAALYLFVRAFL